MGLPKTEGSILLEIHEEEVEKKKKKGNRSRSSERTQRRKKQGLGSPFWRRQRFKTVPPVVFRNQHLLAKKKLSDKGSNSTVTPTKEKEKKREVAAHSTLQNSRCLLMYATLHFQ